MPGPKRRPPERNWDSVPFPGWRDKVNAWTWLPHGDGEWIKEGLCPRCGHHMTVRTGGGTVFGYVRVTTAVRLVLRPVLAACNQCEHTGHPEPPNPLAKGCGQRAQIDPP